MYEHPPAKSGFYHCSLLRFLLEMYKRISDLIGEDNFLKFQDKTVLIVGLGGVGGYSLEALARTGIKSFILIDFDTFEESNMNRQLMAFKDTMNKRKVDVYEEHLKRINRDIKVIKFPIFLDDTSFLDDFSIDYIIDSCDTVKTKASLIKYASLNKIKIISSGGTAKLLSPQNLKVMTLKEAHDPLLKALKKNLEPSYWYIPVVSGSNYQKEKTLGSIVTSPSVAGIYLAHYVIEDIISSGKDQ